MTKVHATAVVSPSARLADDVEVGAYSLIGLTTSRWVRASGSPRT